MQNTQRRHYQVFILLAVLICAVGYLAFLFPQSYFRHDDWGTVRNALDRVSGNWLEIFSYYYDWGPNREIWFFRPFFKLLGYVYYKAFGLSYMSWLTTNFLFFFLAVYFFAHTVWLLTGHWGRVALFVGLYLFGVHFHLGSLLWVGEGNMNCPQMAAVAASTFFLVRACLGSGPAWRSFSYWLSLLAMLVSFGIKEASVFHAFFLVALIRTEPLFSHLGETRVFIRTLAPFLIVGAVYTALRLILVPFNAGYLPHFTLSTLLRPILIFVGALAVPVIALVVASRLFRLGNPFAAQSTRDMVWFAPFFFLTVAPYLGHPFFSPGWLSFVSLYFCFCLSLWVEPRVFHGRWVMAASSLVLCLSVGLAALQARRIAWWDWQEAQVTFTQHLQNLPPGKTNLIVYNCDGITLPGLLGRVVASPASMYDAWRVLRRTDPQIEVRPCPAAESGASPSLPDSSLALRWRFPHWEQLR